MRCFYKNSNLYASCVFLSDVLLHLRKKNTSPQQGDLGVLLAIVTLLLMLVLLIMNFILLND